MYCDICKINRIMQNDVFSYVKDGFIFNGNTASQFSFLESEYSKKFSFRN